MRCALVLLPALLAGCALISDADLDARLDLDGDGVARPDDCDDADASVGEPALYYVDGDGDSYGGTASGVGCLGTGLSAVATDCDDQDPAVHPEAEESCNAGDDDCDGEIDEGVTIPWYFDGDSDGYGAAAPVEEACTVPDGYAATGDDCDDADPALNPATAWHSDADGDGWGGAVDVVGCTGPAGDLLDGTDCDDSRADVSPAAAELCDADDVDEDCDGLSDDADGSASGQTVYYADRDGDSLGSAFDTAWACDPASPYVDNHTDCDDAVAGAGECAWVQVSVGPDHACALRADGELSCWGSGASEPPDAAFVALSAGDRADCGVEAGGTLVCWGSDVYELVSGCPGGRVSAVDVGQYEACALGLDGALDCWGTMVGVGAPQGDVYAQVAIGEEAGCGILPDGSLQAWGWGTSGTGAYLAAAADKQGCVGLRADGTIDDLDAWLTATAPAGSYVALDAGAYDACVLDAAGLLTCWGGSQSGAPLPGTWRQVSVGLGGHPATCAVTDAGRVSCWGDDTNGVIDVPSDVAG